jgi:hypothetical protein
LYGFGLVACLSGCGDADSSSPSSNQGELGRGDFTYHCYDATDAYCADDRSTFPETIALGGAFELDFAEADSRGARVVTGSALVEGDDFGFRAVQPGFAAMLALSGDSQVVDLLHVRIVAPDDLLISVGSERLESFMPLELKRGQRVSARVEPLDPRGNSMAGSVEYGWSTDDGSLLEVITGRGGTQVTLNPLAAGELELVVSAGELEVPFTVVISEAEVPSGDPEVPDVAPPDAGPALTDAALVDGGAQ